MIEWNGATLTSLHIALRSNQQEKQAMKAIAKKCRCNAIFVSPLFDLLRFTNFANDNFVIRWDKCMTARGTLKLSKMLKS